MRYSVFDTFSKTEYIRYSIFGQILLFVTTLLQAIHELCQKDAKHKQSLVNSCKDNSPILKSTAIARTFTKSDPIVTAENAALLSKEILDMNLKNQKSKDETLDIELEPTLPSTKNMEDRDRYDLE